MDKIPRWREAVSRAPRWREAVSRAFNQYQLHE